jgi:hypothetical protein
MEIEVCRNCSWTRIPTRAQVWRCPRCLTHNETVNRPGMVQLQANTAPVLNPRLEGRP